MGEEDAAPALRARRAGVEAARARENSAHMLDEFELRVGDEYLDEHQIQIVARLPIRHPGEVRAQREIYAAEADMAERRLDEATLTRRAELCFPAVEAEARAVERAIYRAYASRQEELLAFNEEVERSGVINEVEASRFELSSRLRLTTRQPTFAPLPVAGAAALPSLDSPDGSLVRSEATLREAVIGHHPSVALHRATAVRYEALAARARSRNQPWIKFVDLSYEHRSGESGPPSDPDTHSRNGGGGRIAFTIPFGGTQKANSLRYSALVREQQGEAAARVEEQVLRGTQALQLLHDFEQRAERLRELVALADGAEEIADRWWESKLAKPSQVAALIDEAFAARSAVLNAREEAGVARCALLAMTGVAAEQWPRETRADHALVPSKPEIDPPTESSRVPEDP
jgi:hypothetical protein